MRQLSVRTPTITYDVLIEANLLERIGGLLRERGLDDRVAVVSDANVGKLYGDRLRRSLEAAEIAGEVFLMRAGEENKTLDTVRQLYDRFLRAGLDRWSVVLALGGGVVGDTAGFAAATFMRGVPLVQVPTTVIAMADASVGGKVGVNLPQGKNLVGAFHQPTLVLADPTLLDTLPRAEFRAGLSEVIKAAIIGDPKLFAHLAEEGTEPLDWVLMRAIDVKRRVVEEDPHEGGRRAVLNLGHTFGHALELQSRYGLPHGLAVSVGMVVAARVAVKLSLCDVALEKQLVAVLEGYDLPTSYSGTTPHQVWEAMTHDKKRRGKELRLVLPRGLGDVIITGDVSKGVVLEALEETHGRRDDAGENLGVARS